MKKAQSLSVDQIEFVCDGLKKWMEICEQNHQNISINGIENSWLLRRILLGKQPLVEKPPTRLGQPAWELIDRDQVEIEEFTETPSGITIDGDDGYSWVDKSKNLLKYDRLNLYFEIIIEEQVPHDDFVDDIEKYKYTSKILKKIHHTS